MGEGGARGMTMSAQRRNALLLRIASLVAFLALWQWYGSDPIHFATPPPTEVFPALWEGITEGEILGATAGTLATLSVGLVISIVFGLILGFAVALFPWARNTLDPLIDAAYAMPVTMLIPVIGVYTGLDFRGRVFIVITYVLLVIVITTSTGVRDVPRDLLETGRAFGLKGRELWRAVILPSAMAHIASGISTGVARGIRGAITAELLLIAADLGAYILDAQARLLTDQLLAGILWTLLLGYVLYAAALWLERRLVRWRTLGDLA
ncbi:ABC transporter permease [Solirubrobacter sp. CPCC 204708]|nr:ABC transporter permease [Solirubrobacter deserti]